MSWVDIEVQDKRWRREKVGLGRGPLWPVGRGGTNRGGGVQLSLRREVFFAGIGRNERGPGESNAKKSLPLAGNHGEEWWGTGRVFRCGERAVRETGVYLESDKK